MQEAGGGEQRYQGQPSRQQTSSQQSSLSRRPVRQSNTGQTRDEKKSDVRIYTHFVLVSGKKAS